MKPFPMHKILVILAIAAAPVFAFAERGGAGPGGGDSNSQRVYNLRQLFRDYDSQYKGNDLRSELSRILLGIDRFAAQGSLSAQIKMLVAKGILKDIASSPYLLSAICKDERGIERSATTMRVNNLKRKNPIHPAICVNMRKLAQEGATKAELMGLLLHEHARHFGLEDTIQDDFHPLANFITLNYTGLASIAYDIMNPANDYQIVSGNHAVQLINDPEINDANYLVIFTVNSSYLELKLKSLRGDCSALQAAIDSDPDTSIRSNAWKYSESCKLVGMDNLAEGYNADTQRCQITEKWLPGQHFYFPNFLDKDFPRVRVSQPESNAKDDSSQCFAKFAVEDYRPLAEAGPALALFDTEIPGEVNLSRPLTIRNFIVNLHDPN